MQKYLLDMRQQVENLIIEGYDNFISGRALGVDQDFAEIVLSFKEKSSKIKLEIAVPCKFQERNWSYDEKERYRNILKRADEVSFISEKRTPFCMQKRNEYMVNKSLCVLAFWNGQKEGGTWNTIFYAQKKAKLVKIYYLIEVNI